MFFGGKIDLSLGSVTVNKYHIFFESNVDFDVICVIFEEEPAVATSPIILMSILTVPHDRFLFAV